jgi:hypothetical protein
MGIEYKLEIKKDYLHLIGKGPYNPSEIPVLIHQVIEACEKCKPSKFLLDFLSVQGELSTMDRFHLAANFAVKYIGGRMAGKFPACKFATVGKPPLFDPKKFGETVALNRGVYVRNFGEIRKALDWLEVEPPES